MTQSENAQPNFTDSELIAVIPDLNRWVHYLCRHPDEADDLLQDTVCRALTSRHLFQHGTNLGAWLFTIARNLFLIRRRRNGRMVSDPDHRILDSVIVPPHAPARLELQDALRAMDRMPAGYKSTLMDIAMGYKYDESARRFNIPEGTVKSRVCRGRRMLLEAGC